MRKPTANINTTNKPQKGEIILFQSKDAHTKTQVRFEEKSVWLSQKNLWDASLIFVMIGAISVRRNGGGSILVYPFGQSPLVATTGSLFVVGSLVLIDQLMKLYWK